MLVLSRKVGEVIWIGDNIKVTVVDMQRQKVKLGIEAPSDTSIVRKELVNDSTKITKQATNRETGTKK
jgi:carbon storage regulator